jgi:hypothetical protein
MIFCRLAPTAPPLKACLTGLVLGLLALGLAACQPSIEVVQPNDAMSPLPAATVAPSEHAISVVGVDFDPPLDAERLLDSGVTLLVAIENQGLRSESDVEVTARLLDPTGTSDIQELLNETVLLDTVSAGEVRVVRFSPVTELPVRSLYKLVVDVSPVEGEEELGDNNRTYDITVHAAE